MASIDRKLRRFEQIAKSNAFKIRDNLLFEIDEKTKDAIKLAKEEYSKEIRDMHVKEIDEAKKEAGYILSSAQNATQSKLIQKRNEIIDSTFNDLISRLKEYTKTEEYVDYLRRKLDNSLAKANSIAKDKNQVIRIILTKEDCEKFRDKATETARTYFIDSDITVEESVNDIIGGCIVELVQSKLLINNTIGSAVDRERENFLQDNELSLK